MEEIERLKIENRELRRECELLHKMLESDRNFFVEELRRIAVENYRQTIQSNREHKEDDKNY